jgi:uncharacterized protein YidB (DUF937 family)
MDEVARGAPQAGEMGMSGLFGMALGGLESMMSGEHAAAAPGLVSTALSASGGLSGLFEKFESAGMSDKISSWMSSGGNLPISAADITKVFTPEQIEAFAAQHGVPADVATTILAHLLPQTVAAAAPAADAAAADAADQQQ